MAYLQSPQNFVRALKAPSDPPKPGEPFKIAIARQGWETLSFYVPNKGEIITDWILTRLLKDRSREADSNPLFNVRYWELLTEILNPSEGSSQAAERANKAWLRPLVYRTPIAPIVISLLSLASRLDPQTSQTLYDTSAPAIVVLWPLAVQKMTPDALLDSYSSLLQALAAASGFPTEQSRDLNLLKIGHLITNSLRAAIGNSSNKKKLSQTFTQNSLGEWIKIGPHSFESGGGLDLMAEIYSAGVEILFNSDTLRQLSDGSPLGPLFSAIQSLALSSPTLVLKTLPPLLTSFAQITRRLRSPLFGNASGNDSTSSARSAAMRFFTLCEDTVEHVKNGDDVEVWRVKLGLLRVVESEGLYGVGQEDAATALKENVESCYRCLQFPVEAAITTMVLECLCVLERIDHDLVDPYITRILPQLLTIQLFPASDKPSSPSPLSSASEFLALIVSYHIQTRTLPTYISQLYGSFTSPLLSDDSSSAQSSYARIMASPVLSSGHMDKLSRAIATFVTPGQTLTTAEAAVRALEDSFDSYNDAEKAATAAQGLGSRKRRRKSKPDGPTEGIHKGSDANGPAMSFVLIAKVVSTVLNTLPLRTVSDSVQNSIHTLVRHAFSGFMATAVSMAVDQVASSDGERIEGSPLKRKNEGPGTWSRHIAGAAALRCRYIVEVAENSFPPASSDNVQEDVDIFYEKLVSVISLSPEDMLPEFCVEIYRSLLGRTTHRAVLYRDMLLDSVLTFLENHLLNAGTTASAPARWSGLSSELSWTEKGKEYAAVALLHLLLDRFLPVVEVHGSAEQRRRLLDLFFGTSAIALDAHDVCEALTSSAAVSECLRSADFWEQANLRTTFFSLVTAKTETLDELDLNLLTARDVRKSIKKKSMLTSKQTAEAAQAYAFLLYTPSEYVPKASRADVLKRAIVLDFVMGQGKSTDDAATSHVLLAVRTFLLRTFVYLGSCEHQLLGEYLHHLICLPPAFASAASKLYSVTLDLIQVHVRSVLRIAEKGNGDTITEVIEMLQELPLSGDPPQSRAGVGGVILRLMSLLIGEFSYSTLPQPVTSSIASLHDHVITKLQSFVEGMETSTGAPNPIENILSRLDLLKLWSQCVSFGAWIRASRKLPRGLGVRLVQALSPLMEDWTTPNARLEEAGITVLGILLAELGDLGEQDRTDQLGRIIAAYVVFMRTSDQAGQTQLDEMLIRLFRGLSVPEYSFSLQLVLESLSSAAQTQDTGRLIRLTSIMLHEAPESTLKVGQTHLTKCLDLFVNQAASGAVTPAIRLQVVKFVNSQCSDRPASIRPLNMAPIWSLLSRYLAGSQLHDSETTVAVFHEIVSVVSALVRLRRDLVINTLPHLNIVLRQLIFSLRSPRPHLGGKQARLVADSLPSWVNPAHPLGPEESKALARLLSTLTVKTIVRVHGPNADAQKPESLAHPLSKHVAYVIQAYIEALNDPLCVLLVDVRRELQPSLFILCGMLNEHARDALMASTLDAGGKAAMKGLWREYEKQRYVGRG